MSDPFNLTQEDRDLLASADQLREIRKDIDLRVALQNLLYATEDWELLSAASRKAFQDQARVALNTD